MKEDLDMDRKWRLVTVIVEKGYADDVMAEAREAGAKGGTVVHGHGTANEYDAIFCGVHLVPEKEILLIVAEEETVDEIKNRISSMDCLCEKGMGVMFSVPVSDFSILGN